MYVKLLFCGEDSVCPCRTCKNPPGISPPVKFPPLEKFFLKFLNNFYKFVAPLAKMSLTPNHVLRWARGSLRPATLLKKRLWHRCFSVSLAKFLRTPFVTEHLWATASEGKMVESKMVESTACTFTEKRLHRRITYLAIKP